MPRQEFSEGVSVSGDIRAYSDWTYDLFAHAKQIIEEQFNNRQPTYPVYELLDCSRKSFGGIYQ